jgi:hypothetical protein
MPCKELSHIHGFDHSKPTKVIISVSEWCKIGDVYNDLSTQCQIPLSSMLLVKVDAGLVSKIFQTTDPVSAVGDDDVIILYIKEMSLDGPRETTHENQVLFFLFHRVQVNNEITPYGVPLLFTVCCDS